MPKASSGSITAGPLSSANNGLPLPLGRGVCETKSKNGRSRPPKPFICRIFCVQRGIETMVSEGARSWGRGRSGDLRSRLPGKETKTPEPRKYEKNTKKIQNPPPRVGPQKNEKNTEKIRKWAENDHFRIFSLYFFRIFRAWGILYFLCIFFVFSGFRGVWALYQASGIVTGDCDKHSFMRCLGHQISPRCCLRRCALDHQLFAERASTASLRRLGHRSSCH